MNIKDLFQVALHIFDPWYVSDIDFDEERKILNIHIDFKKGTTFYYEDLEENVTGNFKPHDTVNKRWRHLNFFEHECYLNARVPRVKINDGKVRLIKTPWEGISSGFTLLFEAIILQLVKNMTVHGTSRLTNVNDHKLWNLLDCYVNKTLDLKDFSDVDTIGIDETSQKKHHNYITLFVDLKERSTLFIAEGKSNKTVKEFSTFFEDHKGKPEEVTNVSCDMSPAFIKGVKKYLPMAAITFDKFHIMKLINKAVDKVRREEVKHNPLLKGTKYIFLKNKENLSEKQKNQLESISLSKQNLKTLKALQIRESFQDIYNAEDQETFEMLLKKWYFWATHSRIEEIKGVAKTIKAHWAGIIEWKRSQINNGILEGLNSLIQAAKAKARGYRTPKNFKIIAYLLTGKLNFNLVNKSYLPT